MSKLCLAISLLLLCLFLVSCDESEATTASNLDPDGPRAAFDAYRASMRGGEIGLLKSVLSAGAREGLSGVDESVAVGMLQSMTPKEEQVTGVNISGDTATIHLTTDNGGDLATGKVLLVREDGAWKVEKESWDLGGGSRAPEPETADIPDMEPDGDWRLDCHQAKLPDSPAAGRIGGRPFTVRYARIQNAILTLTDGDLFDNTGQFMVFLFLHGDDKTVAGRTVSIGPERDWDAKVAAHVHYHYDVEDGDNVMEAKTDGFALRIEFGEEKDGKLPGKIHLTYPDESKSFVVGSFNAIVE